ncbi:MAG: purine-nucleoside phosphorylase [Sphaerochaetaceae bacterium]|jgi:purine-nucleoside phosphorylase
MKTPTVHNQATLGQIAETILLPGDPLRAKFIAENFLEDVQMYTQVRGMYGYTGTYKGTKLSVQGSGMGGPSMAIYAHELINAYKVKKLIRIGSAGSLQPNLTLGSLIGATAASYNTNYTSQFNLPGTVAPVASFDLMAKAKESAKKMNLTLNTGPILSSDAFYTLDGADDLRRWQQVGLLAVEMEAASLYLTAQIGGAEALCLLTISDLPFGNEEMSSEQRERSLTDMINLALDVAIS